MFNDLPGIDPDFDSSLQDPVRGQGNYGPYSFRASRGGLRTSEVPTGFYPDLYQPVIHGPILSHMDSIGNTHYDSLRYQNEPVKSSWYPYIPDAPLRPDKCTRWPAKALMHGTDSPSPCVTDGTGSEDDSNVGPSQWGVERMARNHFDTHHGYLRATSTGPLPPMDDAHGDAVGSGTQHFTEAVACDGSCAGSGIKMEDVQQYPDSYSEDHFNELNSQEQDAIHINSIDARPSPYPNPEDHPLSPASSVSYEDNVKEESMNEDEDDGSDYAPRSSGRSRASRTSRPRKYSQNTNKPSGRFSKRSNSGRVTKRSQKASVTSEAAPFTSNRISCPHCAQSVHSKAHLNKHIATTHTRPFTCTFRQYGCMSTFGSKNEWKRHVFSQHLRLGFWRCQLGRCYPEHSADDGDEEEELVFNDFNRKDLFMQHLRRMHAPHASSPAAEKAAFNASLDSMTQDCFVAVRGTPPRSVCGYCVTGEGNQQVFEGPGAWEARMEHVGRHLESGHGEAQAWVEDEGLKNWLAAEGLIEDNDTKGWRLVGLHSDERSRRR